MSAQQAAELAWQALEPNTSSHDRSSWEIVKLQSASGREIDALFEGGPVPGSCAPGPKPPANLSIASDEEYWYVRFTTRHATPVPPPTEQYAPTAPPHVPEPYVYEARILISPTTGQVVARKLLCVVY